MSIKVTVPALAHSLRFERILVISALHPTPDVSQRCSKRSEGPATNLLTKDEARHLSVNFAKLLRRRRSTIRSELGVRTGSTRVWGETTGVVLGRQPHGVHVYAKLTLQDQLAQWQIRSPIQLAQFGITIWDRPIERVRPAPEVSCLHSRSGRLLTIDLLRRPLWRQR